ncbi:lytic transglycosylase domain-containing protein [Sulfitobacter sp. S190]|uniref:lytic transglycosylase domain-containing protein n=1 Tax=Sulfitobacter sp. S190 TaxID=2867022 RepID=UPI0021A702CB|nr:lytic transglycosylase domain-containing protein [Sulfitobacter sp. S190]UWR23643.1 lytic transglycosylase domain-containing protein [Sulfitobacter sp. S190]
MKIRIVCAVLVAWPFVASAQQTSPTTDVPVRADIAGPVTPADLGVSAEGAPEDADGVAVTQSGPQLVITTRPPARNGAVPRTRWQHMTGHAVWTRAALSALKDHGKPLVDMVPRDIESWCPAYSANNDAKRRAFWVGYMSALAKHESTYKPWAVGGGGKWYGLLQILPATARGYQCNVGTGEALKNGAANLSCGVRIMAHTVQRDGVIHGRDSRWRGVSADWGPMRNPRKRADMANWLKRQTYCKRLDATRPRPRP